MTFAAPTVREHKLPFARHHYVEGPSRFKRDGRPGWMFVFARMLSKAEKKALLGAGWKQHGQSWQCLDAPFAVIEGGA